MRWVREREPECVERLPRKVDRPQHVGAEHVALLADQRVSVQPGLQANLIALAGMEANLDQRGIAE